MIEPPERICTTPMKKICRVIACFVMGIVIALGAAALPAQAEEPALKPGEVVPLWEPGQVPQAKGEGWRHTPRLHVYLAPAESRDGAAVVICPGGGYGNLAMDHEGHQVARWLNSLGVAGLILEYRHRGHGYGHPVPLLDAQRAMRTARAQADAWKLDPRRIGILGFSAGGHLASSAGVHFDEGRSDAEDPVERVSCRPDFLVLCYPVIAFGEPFTHVGSQHNLLGSDAPADLVQKMSSEKQVTKETPPTFLFHTDGDHGVPPENSIAFYRALHRAGVPAELHIYQTGGHGQGLAAHLPGTSDWPGRCAEWLRVRGLLKGN